MKVDVKRDMDLVRDILTTLAEAPFTGDRIQISGDGGHTPEEITYHIIIMYEAGLIHAVPPLNNESIEWNPVYLTWSGHEFLEAAKDDTRWDKAKSYMKEKGGAMVFETFKAVLLSYVNQQVFGKPSYL